MEEPYDSTKDTQAHIARVKELLEEDALDLLHRADIHDFSKLLSPEKEGFDRETPLLKDLEYDSEEYRASLKRLQETLDHHYALFPHHPEHYEHGINDMTLRDVMEMLDDWIAATERHTNGNIFVSLKKNKDRFHLDDQLYGILVNSVKARGFVEPT